MSRPKTFNPDNALEKAMQVFWHKGYEAASMEDLLEAMDINRGSLYDTFGDKRQLFLKSLDHYCRHVAGQKFLLLTQPGPALPCVRRFIREMIDGAVADPQRRGCLLINTIMELAPHERDIASTTHRVLQMGQDAIFATLARAQQQGELPSEKDPRVLACFLSTMMQGTIVMIKSGASAEAVTESIETALAVLE